MTIDGELIETTAEHPFYELESAPWLAVGQTAERWTDALELENGDLVWQADGTTGVVQSREIVAREQRMYNLTVAEARTFFVGREQWLVHNVDCNKLVDGMSIAVDDALDAAENFLGKGYTNMGNGRFVSGDGLRQVRMGDSDILGKHGGGSHMNFETLAPNPKKPGKMEVVENKHIYLTGE